MKKDPVIEKLIEHDAHFEHVEGRLETIESKLDGVATKDQMNEMITKLGEVLVAVKRLDQERIVMARSIARIHDKDTEQDTEILRIKTHVGMR